MEFNKFTKYFLFFIILEILHNTASASGNNTTGPTYGPVTNFVLTTSKPSGVLYSPNYPGNYFSNANNQFYIRVDANVQGHAIKRIQLNFTNVDIELQPNCQFDYIKIYEMISTSGQWQANGSFCGNQTKLLVSKSNQVRIDWITDGGITKRGWVLNYGIYNDLAWKSCKSSSTEILATRTTIRILLSPNAPGIYPNLDDQCYFFSVGPTIPNASNYRIKYDFTHMDVEISGQCDYDYLAFYEKINGSWTSTEKLCGKDKQVVISSVGESLLHWHTDEDTGLTGWLATISVVEAEATTTTTTTTTSAPPTTTPVPLPVISGLPSATCTWVNYTDGQAKTLQSPGYPNNYTAKTDICYFFHSADISKVYEVNFKVFDMMTSNQCSKDYIAVYSIYPAKKSLGKFCNATSASLALKSFGHGVVLHFHTEGTNSASRFQFDIKPTSTSQSSSSAACRGTIVLKKEGEEFSFQTDNHPHNYDSNSNYCWLIENTLNNVTSLEFTASDLKLDGTCKDYVAIYVGPARDIGKRVVKLCNNTVFNSTITCDKHAVVHFVSDGSQQFSGAKIRARVVKKDDKKCFFRAPQQGCCGHKDDDDDSKRIGLTIGIVIAGILLLILLIVLGVFLAYKCKKSETGSTVVPSGGVATGASGDYTKMDSRPETANTTLTRGTTWSHTPTPPPTASGNRTISESVSRYQNDGIDEMRSDLDPPQPVQPKPFRLPPLGVPSIKKNDTGF